MKSSQKTGLNPNLRSNAMKDQSQFTLAAVQAAPVYFDRDASTEKACRLIEAAAKKGALLAAFSETWLPGYPFFYNSSLQGQASQEYLANAVEIPSATTDRLCKVAQSAYIDVAIGIAELDATTHGTVYCTLLFIGREGKILGRHRKLKPTFRERTVWGEGDGVGLTVYERSYGRISGLNCWEHKMVLPGYVLMARGTQVHVATWPFVYAFDITQAQGHLLSQAFAAQGSCFVVAVAALLRPDDVPDAYRKDAKEWVKQREGRGGGSCIISPGGAIIAEAPVDEEIILTAPASLEAVLRSKASVDVGGHYSRPDILQLQVNRHPLGRIVEMGPLDKSHPIWNVGAAPQGSEVGDERLSGNTEDDTRIS